MALREAVESLKSGQAKKKIPDFSFGDTVKVHLRVFEKDKERIQVFQGTVIGRKTRGISSSFTVRKVTDGVGVERVFPLYSPLISKIQVVRRGKVRRAKLYYLRELKGKAARVKEKRVK